MSPQFLEQYQIPYTKLLQQPREFVVTYPGAYHAGFNQVRMGPCRRFLHSAALQGPCSTSIAPAPCLCSPDPGPCANHNVGVHRCIVPCPQGFNCAESVNFGTKKWIPVGARAGVCECHDDAVAIDMRLFRCARLFQGACPICWPRHQVLQSHSSRANGGMWRVPSRLAAGIHPGPPWPSFSLQALGTCTSASL